MTERVRFFFVSQLFVFWGRLFSVGCVNRMRTHALTCFVVVLLAIGMITVAEEEKETAEQPAKTCVRTVDLFVDPMGLENVVLTVDNAISRPVRPNTKESLALDFCETDLHHVRVNGAVFDLTIGNGGSLTVTNNPYPDGVKLSKKGLLKVQLAECSVSPENKYYFDQHERFDIRGLLKSPMVLMCAPALLSLIMPHLVDKKDVADMLNTEIVSNRAPFFEGAERRFDCLPETEVNLKPIEVIDSD